VSYIGKDNLAIMTVCAMVHLPVGLSLFPLRYLKLRSVVVSLKKTVIGNSTSTDTAFAIERRLYSHSGVTAAPSIAINMSQNTVRHIETDMCHV
jgi:hypothetical protein